MVTRSTTIWGRFTGGAFIWGALLCLSLAPTTWGERWASAAGAQASWAGAWPMVGHDPQRTNRSASVGPLHPRLLFTDHSVIGPVLIDPDGSLYTSSYDQSTRVGGLVALTATGQRRWSVALSAGEGGPPALAPDGSVLVNANDGTGEVIAAVAPSGQRTWTIRSLPWTVGLHETPHSKGEPPLVTAAGSLYVPLLGPEFKRGDNVGLQVVSPVGTPLRVLQHGTIPYAVAVARDGTVYELAARCCTGPVSLLALSPMGTLLWTRSLGFVPNYVGLGLLVGASGTIYASDGAGIGTGQASEIVAYTPAGRRLWRARTSEGTATLAERADGVVLVATATSLTALRPNGTRVWRRALGRRAGTGAVQLHLPSLAVDAAGRVYVGSSDGVVRAIGPDGVQLWTLGHPNPLGAPSVALGPEGQLAVASDALRVYW